jgi:hypothetical protein
VREELFIFLARIRKILAFRRGKFLFPGGFDFLRKAGYCAAISLILWSGITGYPQFKLISSASAAQTIPKILNYQARITSATGTPVSDGSLAVKFTIYDAASGGTCRYTTRGTCGTPTAKSVTVTNGVFSTLLGDTAAGDNDIPDNLFDTSALYLGISVATDSEMVPRKRLSSAPYAFNADRLDNLDTSATGGTQAFIPVTSATGSLTLSADLTVAGTGSFGNLIVNGTCTGCGGGGSSGTLQQAYDSDVNGGNVTITTNSTDGALVFAGDQNFLFTSTGDVNFDSDTFVVDSSVNRVGIGTNAPLAPLEVRSGTVGILVDNNANAFSSIDIDSGGAAADFSVLRFFDRGTNKWELRKNSSNNFDIRDATNALVPFTIEAAAPGDSLYVRATTGNVGLGTSTASEKLEVVGNAKIGVITVGATAANFVNLDTNNDGSMLLSSNISGGNCAPGSVLTTSQSHGALSGAGINIPANGCTRQGNIEFWTTPVGAVTAGAAYPQSSPRMVINNAGFVGIGNSAPANLLTVGNATSTFEVNAGGDIVRINAVTYSWPATQGGASSVLTNNGSGVLTWAAAGGGGTTLQTAYDSSTGTTEIFLGATHGALTLADSFSSYNGNLFEIQDRTNAAGDYSRRYFTVSSTSTNLTYNSVTTGTAASITANALTTGTGLAVTGTGTGLTGNMLLVQTASTGAFSSGGARFNFTGAHTGTGVQIDDVTTAGTAMRINANSITTGAGNGLVISANGMTSTVGSALLVTSSGAYTGVAGLVDIIASGATTGKVMRIDANALTTGQALFINNGSGYTGTTGVFGVVSNATTGTLADIAGAFLTSGVGLNLSGGGATALTTGSVLRVTGPTGAAALSTNGVVQIVSIGNYTSTANAALLNVAANSTTAGTVANITGNAVTNGTVLSVSGGQLDNSGTLISASSTAAGGGSNQGIIKLQANMRRAPSTGTPDQNEAAMKLFLNDIADNAVSGSGIISGYDLEVTSNSFHASGHRQYGFNADLVQNDGSPTDNTWDALYHAINSDTATGNQITVTSGFLADNFASVTGMTNGFMVRPTLGTITNGFAIGATGTVTNGINFTNAGPSVTNDFVMQNGIVIHNNTNGTLAFTDGTNTLCTIVDAGTTGNFTCTGTVGGGSATLQTAYDSSTGTTEIFLSSARGALTLADSFSSYGGNLFEIQNRVNAAGDYDTRYFTVSATSTQFGNVITATKDNSTATPSMLAFDGRTTNSTIFPSFYFSNLEADPSSGFTASSGTQNFTYLNAVINQSGSAGFDAFDINVTENTIGAGAVNLLRLMTNNSDVFTVNDNGNLTMNGDLRVDGGDITSPVTSTFNLLNTNVTTLNIGGVATTMNVGVGGSTAATLNFLGGSGATGCTMSGNTGNLTCSGMLTINGSSVLGNASSSDQVDFSGSRILGNLTPAFDNTVSLGDYDRRWKDLWLAGGSAKIALDTSGTSILQIGFESAQGLRGVVKTPDNIPLQLRSGNSSTGGITITSAGTTINNLTVTGTCSNCGGGGTLQSAYNSSTSPELTLDSTRGALTIVDAVSPTGANFLEVLNRHADAGYFTVSATTTTISTQFLDFPDTATPSVRQIMFGGSNNISVLQSHDGADAIGFANNGNQNAYINFQNINYGSFTDAGASTPSGTDFFTFTSGQNRASGSALVALSDSGTPVSGSSMLELTGAGTAGTGINLTANTYTNGTGMKINANALTSGSALSLASTSPAGTSATMLNVIYNPPAATTTIDSNTGINDFYGPTYSTAVTTPFIFGSVASVRRTITTNGAFASTLSVSGPVADFVENSIQTTGTITSTSDVVRITQNYTSNTGSALEVIQKGTGNAISVNQSAGNLFQVNATGHVFASLTNANSFALCHATNGAGNLQEITDCSGTPAADYMEMYPAATGLEVGDIVMPGTVTVSVTGGAIVPQVVKTASAYEGAMLGVISNPKDAGDFNSIGHEIAEGDNPLPLALVGRVRVKVNMENGAIKAGDPVTSSSVAGVGMKSTKPGMVVGVALSGWDGPGQGTILLFINVGWRSGNGVPELIPAPVLAPAPQVASASGTASLAAAGPLMSADGLWSISADGRLVVREVETKLLKTEEIMVVQSASATAIAEGKVPKGKTSVVIKNGAMKPGSKVFVSFLADSNGNSWITDKADGAFTLRLKTAPKKDLPFEYWIISVDDQRPKEAPAK